jgi:hypothetical protein
MLNEFIMIFENWLRVVCWVENPRKTTFANFIRYYDELQHVPERVVSVLTSSPFSASMIRGYSSRQWKSSALNDSVLLGQWRSGGIHVRTFLAISFRCRCLLRLCDRVGPFWALSLWIAVVLWLSSWLLILGYLWARIQLASHGLLGRALDRARFLERSIA